MKKIVSLTHSVTIGPDRDAPVSSRPAAIFQTIDTRLNTLEKSAVYLGVSALKLLALTATETLMEPMPETDGSTTYPELAGRFFRNLSANLLPLAGASLALSALHNPGWARWGFRAVNMIMHPFETGLGYGGYLTTRALTSNQRYADMVWVAMSSVGMAIDHPALIRPLTTDEGPGPANGQTGTPSVPADSNRTARNPQPAPKPASLKSVQCMDLDPLCKTNSAYLKAFDTFCRHWTDLKNDTVLQEMQNLVAKPVVEKMDCQPVDGLAISNIIGGKPVLMWHLHTLIKESMVSNPEEIRYIKAHELFHLITMTTLKQPPDSRYFNLLATFIDHVVIPTVLWQNYRIDEWSRFSKKPFIIKAEEILDNRAIDYAFSLVMFSRREKWDMTAAVTAAQQTLSPHLAAKLGKSLTLAQQIEDRLTPWLRYFHTTRLRDVNWDKVGRIYANLIRGLEKLIKESHT